MNFKSEEKLYLFLKNLYKLGMASEGICYTDGNLVYKVFHEFRLSNEEYASILDESKITIFKNIQNDTYIFPFNAIKLKGKAISCIYN